MSLSRNLSNEGILDRPAKFTFEFPSVEMPYESYSGMHVRVRYLLRVTFARQYGMSQTESLELWVRNPEALPEVNNPIKMEVSAQAISSSVFVAAAMVGCGSLTHGALLHFVRDTRARR